MLSERVSSPPTPTGSPLPRRKPGASDRWWSLINRNSAPSRRPAAAFDWFRPARGSAVALLLLLVVSMLAGCGSRGPAATGPAAPAAVGPARLAGVCPAPVVIQTSWYPESTHGGLYEL